MVLHLRIQIIKREEEEEVLVLQVWTDAGSRGGTSLGL